MRTKIVYNEESLEEARKSSEATNEGHRSQYAARVADVQKKTSNIRLRKRSSAILREDRSRK